MLVQQENRCGSCSKVFCCPTCRLAHEKAKHPQRNPKCSICHLQPLQIKNLDDSELVSHVVSNHLPLMCRLCGVNFQNSDDIKKHNECKWWSRKKEPTGPPAFITSSIHHLHSPLISSKPKTEDLNSPPDFTRHTSTPMPCTNFNPVLKNLGSLKNFFLKTPKSLSYSSLGGKCTTLESRESLSSASTASTERFYTGRSKIELDSKRSSTASAASTSASSSSQMGSPAAATNSIPCIPSSDDVETKMFSEIDSSSEFQKLTLSDFREENKENEKSDKLRRSDSSEKKVKFSEPTGTMSLENSEIFFEAKDESFEIPEERLLVENEINTKIESNQKTTTSEVSEQNENEGNESKVVLHQEKEDGEKNKCACRRNCEYCQNNGQYVEEESQAGSSTTSRLLMMVVVEKSTNGFSSTKLAPLINNELKKLEKNVIDVTEEEEDAFCQKISQYRGEVVNEDFVSVSLEFSAEHDMNLTRSSNETPAKKSDDASKADGIFSAVARAVKSALTIFPGAGQQTNHSEESLLGVEGSSSENFSSDESGHRPNKRPREVHTESIDEIYSNRCCQNDASKTQDVVHSPAAKRHRGWYRIKGREPIDRMKKQEISLRGISSETQCFQHGSLTAKNSVIPIPSRANRYTQTD